MRSSRLVDETYLAEWLERLTANAEVATVLGATPASSDTVESEGRQIKYIKLKKKYPCLVPGPPTS
jgi:hypothetical protein